MIFSVRKKTNRSLFRSMLKPNLRQSPLPTAHPRQYYPAIFVSDTHLGTKAARADRLAIFLKSVDCDELFLVGDIIDGWRLKKSWYWDTHHNDVIRTILKMAKSGTKIWYIPGNHDEALRPYSGLNLAGIEIRQEAVYEARNGKKYWVIHGDEFDSIVKYAKWLAYIGDRAYGILLSINTTYNRFRQATGLGYWSLSSYLKRKVKNAVEYISRFEDAVAFEAKNRGVDGVICGHIHHAEKRLINGIEYMNDGDWVESCTALVEKEDGSWSILNYEDLFSSLDSYQTTLVTAAE